MASLKPSLAWILFVYIICITSVLVMADSSKGNDFIDPLDPLNFDPINMRMKLKDKEVPQQPPTDTRSGRENEKLLPENEKPPPANEICPPCKVDDVCSKVKGMHETVTSLLRQYSMSLVRLMESEVSSASHPTLLDLRVSITYHGLTKLRNFGKGSNSDFHSLHEELSSLMQFARPVVHQPRYYWLEDKLGLSLPMMGYVTVVILATLLLVIAVGHLRLNRELIWRFFFLVFIISVGLTMIEMYQGKVAEQEEILKNSVRKHCPKAEEMSVWERLYSYVTSSVTFEDDNCKKFMKAMLVNPLYTVSPMEAVAVSIVKTIVTPMDLIGQGIKNFLVGLLKGLPLQLQTFVLVCLFCLLILCPLLLMGYSFSVFFNLINIGPQPVVKEIQYVQPNPAPSISQHNRGSLDQTSPTHSVDNPPPRPQTMLESEGSGRALHPTSVNRPAEIEGFRRGCASHQPVIQALPLEKNEEANATSLHMSSGQNDSGDSNIKQDTGCEVENREMSAGHIFSCGDNKGRGFTDLCHKLAEVDISENSSSNNDESQIHNANDMTRRIKDESTANPNTPDSASAELAGELQKIKLQEAAVSTKPEDGLDIGKGLKTNNEEALEKNCSSEPSSEHKAED